MEALVKSCNICWVWSGIPLHAQHCSKNNMPMLQKGLSYFDYLLHAVTHPWKLQRYHAVWYGLACPKFSKIANCQCLSGNG